MKAAAGDPKAMKIVSGVYEHSKNPHHEMSYMWLSLAMENAALTDKKRIRKYLEEFIIPKLSVAGITIAEKRMNRAGSSRIAVR